MAELKKLTQRYEECEIDLAGLEMAQWRLELDISAGKIKMTDGYRRLRVAAETIRKKKKEMAAIAMAAANLRSFDGNRF